MPIKVKTQYSSLLADGAFKIEAVNELNFFDLLGDKAKTKGSSNKQYHAEIHICDSGKYGQIYTMYGATGGNQSKDYRHYCMNGDADKGIGDLATIYKDYEKLLASKRKKGYKDIDVAIRAIGSDAAKNIIKPIGSNKVPDVIVKSSINDGQKQIIDIFFGAQDQFVSQTLKCPLGQLTNKQIDDGRTCLNLAKNIVNANSVLSDDNNKQLLELTNEFYGLIPHNLGSGARGQLSHLLLNDLQKIVNKESDLDTLLDAKDVGAVIHDNGYDGKFKSLNADFELLNNNSAIFSYLSSYFEDTKVNHHRSSAHVKRIWKLNRLDNKEKSFETNVKNISALNLKNTFVDNSKNRLLNANKYSCKNRPDLNTDQKHIYDTSNTWMCWHGTRSANLVGITRKGLLIRPSGAIYTGSLYGDARYFSWHSSKSLQYTDNSYYTGGNKGGKKYMFLLDVALGNMHLTHGPKFFSSPPSGHHSVYAKSNVSGVLNDEMMTYEKTDNDNQAKFRYILEIM